jgi:hypothetical protein
VTANGTKQPSPLLSWPPGCLVRQVHAVSAAALGSPHGSQRSRRRWCRSQSTQRSPSHPQSGRPRRHCGPPRDRLGPCWSRRLPTRPGAPSWLKALSQAPTPSALASTAGSPTAARHHALPRRHPGAQCRSYRPWSPPGPPTLARDVLAGAVRHHALPRHHHGAVPSPPGLRPGPLVVLSTRSLAPSARSTPRSPAAAEHTACRARHTKRISTATTKGAGTDPRIEPGATAR